jgi:hypothetical protein
MKTRRAVASLWRAGWKVKKSNNTILDSAVNTIGHNLSMCRVVQSVNEMNATIRTWAVYLASAMIYGRHNGSRKFKTKEWKERSHRVGSGVVLPRLATPAAQVDLRSST